MSDQLKGWIANQMETTLGFSDPSLVQHIVSIDNQQEAERYLKDFFGDNQRLISEFIKRRFPHQPKRNSNQRQKRTPFDKGGLVITNKGKNKKGKYGKKGNQDQQSTDNNNAEKNNSSVPTTPTTPQTASALSAALFGSSSTPEPDELNEYVRPDSPEPEPVKAPMGKWAKKPEIKDTILKDDFVLPKAYRKEEPKRARKKKYRNINELSDVILLPGRHMCDCQAQKHDLIGNCLSCGRIICAQEGEGPCLFCGALVSGESACANASDDGLAKAIEHKNRLLDFDRNATRRTEVVDDESDYYKGVDEAKVREQRHGSRLNKKFTLNLESETLEERTVSEFIEDEAKKLPKKEIEERENRKENLFFNEDLKSNRFIFNLKAQREKNQKSSSKKQTSFSKNRVQDDRLKEMFDEGTCLTMHQPWASLLIKGIKVHEGRVWNSSHRGRLWIHSASQEPDQDLITQQLSAAGLLDQKDEFDWPIGCLLGFCTVTDVLAQDDYREKYPDGPSQAPYVFICEDVHELDFKLQISGQHKLWKLPRELHQSARLQLNL